MRTQRTNGTTTYQYTYLGSQLTHMTVGEHTLYFAYDAAGIPLSLTYDGENYYYITNIQGDVVAILDDTGNEVVRYAYDAWGNLISTTDLVENTVGLHNPLRYRGYVYDVETELYYLQSRYYNPEMGRFINGDCFTSTGQGVLGSNMFVYCNNNPVNYKDPSGNIAVLVGIGIAIGGAIAIAIDHHVAKRAPDGAALFTEDHEDGVKEKWVYAEGNGFDADRNGITLCDSEIGLLDIEQDDGITEKSLFQAFSASATAELDWSGTAPSVDISAVASMCTVDFEYTVSLLSFDFTFSAAVHIGAAGVGGELDPEEGKFKVTPPTTGIIPTIGFDVDF